MQRREINWDAIVSRARDQREQAAAKPGMDPRTVRVAIWFAVVFWSLGFGLGTIYVRVFGWPW
jgi:hypothetical protein